MRVAVYGAGAVGGYLAAKLADANVDITLIARGEALRAIRAEGLRIVDLAESTVTHAWPRCEGDPAAVGPVDAVVVALKAHAIPPAASGIAQLLGPDTSVTFAVNGVPYWYHYASGGRFDGHGVESVDPSGAVRRHIPFERAVGCIVYPALDVEAPGVVRHVYGDRFSLGEPNGSKSARVVALADALRTAGITAKVTTRIRDELWIKLWGNLAFNPISMLTRATLDRIVGEADTRALCRTMMLEARAVAEALGVRFAMTVDRRMQGAEAVGAHRTSMLQDFERGRAVELDALLGAVVEFSDMTGIAAPTCRAVLALARQCADVAGCLPRAR